MGDGCLPVRILLLKQKSLPQAAVCVAHFGGLRAAAAKHQNLRALQILSLHLCHNRGRRTPSCRTYHSFDKVWKQKSGGTSEFFSKSLLEHSLPLAWPQSSWVKQATMAKPKAMGRSAHA